MLLLMFTWEISKTTNSTVCPPNQVLSGVFVREKMSFNIVECYFCLLNYSVAQCFCSFIWEIFQLAKVSEKISFLKKSYWLFYSIPNIKEPKKSAIQILFSEIKVAPDAFSYIIFFVSKLELQGCIRDVSFDICILPRVQKYGSYVYKLLDVHPWIEGNALVCNLDFRKI